MRRTDAFDEWCDGASDEDLQAMEEAAKKQYHKFLLISLIPIINMFTMGQAIFCYNNLSYIRSRGRSTGNVVWRFILLLYSLFLIPLLVINICSKNDNLANKVLGWNKL